MGVYHLILKKVQGHDLNTSALYILLTISGLVIDSLN